MVAAVYARKSTEQAGFDDEAKSVARQVEHARAFAESKGWTVADAHVYVDDGVSGAIFGEGRPGLMRLLNALQPRPAFDVLVMSEDSRLGREMHQTAHLFGEITRAGVRVWSYLDGRERKLDNAIDKMMMSLSAFASELEREKARQRTRDAMLRKAKAGHVTGGRVFGYDNLRVDGHVERRINEVEATTVRRIYELAALGHGNRTIAHALNADGCPAPRPQAGRPAGWAPSSVRDVLGRPIYRGIIEWDRNPRNNERKQIKRNANIAPLRIEAEGLRIISPELALAVDHQREDRRERYLRKSDGRLLSGPAPRLVKHVLAGLLRCTCGASYEAQSAVYGRRRGGMYVCSARRRKGSAICSNDLHLPIADTEAAILEAVERELLDASIFEAAIDLALDRLTRQQADAAGLVAERERLAREIGHLVDALARGGDVPSLVAELRTRESRKADLDRRLIQPTVTRDALRERLAERLADWRRLLRSRPTHGQRVLRTLLEGPIQVGSPTAQGVPWKAQGSLGGLLGTLSTCMASPTGFEPVF
jgi:site-specific DNA recombinase